MDAFEILQKPFRDIDKNTILSLKLGLNYLPHCNSVRKFSFQQISKFIQAPQPVSNLSIQGFSVDSRTINPGELYFALPGDKVDGSSFLSEVSKKNVLAAVVSQDYCGEDYGLLLLKVTNVLHALQRLAKEAILHNKPQVVGVTGSVGKTTTKDFIYALLKTKFKVAASPGNSNSQIGLPLAVLNNTTGDEEILILEMGMTAKGHIRDLIEIAPPDIALITKTGLVHACNFDSINDIALAKGEIFLSPKTRLGILDFELDNFLEVSKLGCCKKLTFSLVSDCADYYLTSDAHQTIFYEKNIGFHNFASLPIRGKHNRHNFLAAAAVAHNLGMSLEEIGNAVSALKLPERRLECIEKNGIIFVNDSYNASMLSIKAALESLPDPKPGGKKIAVIGEMLELGSFSEPCHAEIGSFALKHVDRMLCLGKETLPIVQEWHKAKSAAKLFLDRSELVVELREQIQPGDVVLLKGSRSKGMWHILDEL